MKQDILNYLMMIYIHKQTTKIDIKGTQSRNPYTSLSGESAMNLIN